MQDELKFLIAQAGVLREEMAHMERQRVLLNRKLDNTLARIKQLHDAAQPSAADLLREAWQA